jgi:hypothetical protein
MSFFRTSFTPNPVPELLEVMYNVRDWLSPINPQLHNISNPHVFVLAKSDTGSVVLKYKNWSRDETGYLAMIQTKDQWCSPGMLTRGALQQGRIFGITAGGGGGGELVFSLINISFPKIVGERSIFHYHFFLPLLLFNLRHSNIFKICPTKLYGYTR